METAARRRRLSPVVGEKSDLSDKRVRNEDIPEGCDPANSYPYTMLLEFPAYAIDMPTQSFTRPEIIIHPTLYAAVKKHRDKFFITDRVAFQEREDETIFRWCKPDLCIVNQQGSHTIQAFDNVSPNGDGLRFVLENGHKKPRNPFSEHLHNG